MSLSNFQVLVENVLNLFKNVWNFQISSIKELVFSETLSLIFKRDFEKKLNKHINK